MTILTGVEESGSGWQIQMSIEKEEKHDNSLHRVVPTFWQVVRLFG
jgi:hypothetical protein